MDGKKKLRLILFACLAAVAAGVVAVTVFQVPARSLFFFSMIAVCPLMHVLMGHGAHGHGGAGASTPEHETARKSIDTGTG